MGSHEPQRLHDLSADCMDRVGNSANDDDRAVSPAANDETALTAESGSLRLPPRAPRTHWTPRKRSTLEYLLVDQFATVLT